MDREVTQFSGRGSGSPVVRGEMSSRDFAKLQVRRRDPSRGPESIFRCRGPSNSAEVHERLNYLDLKSQVSLCAQVCGRLAEKLGDQLTFFQPVLHHLSLLSEAVSGLANTSGIWLVGQDGAIVGRAARRVSVHARRSFRLSRLRGVLA